MDHEGEWVCEFDRKMLPINFTEFNPRVKITARFFLNRDWNLGPHAPEVRNLTTATPLKFRPLCLI